VFEFVAEVLVERTGHMLIRVFRPRSDPSDIACIAVGLVFWAGVIVVAVYAGRSVFSV